MSWRGSWSPPVSPVHGAGRPDEDDPAVRLLESAEVLAVKAAGAVLEDCISHVSSESDGYYSADSDGYYSADADDGYSGPEIYLLAAAWNDELIRGRPYQSDIKLSTSGKASMKVKRHPMLLVTFFHALQEQECLSSEANRSIDAFFRIPIQKATRACAGTKRHQLPATSLNTWQSIRISTVAEAEGFVILCAAARAACGLCIELASVAGTVTQNPFYRKAVMKTFHRGKISPFTAFLTRVLEDNQPGFDMIQQKALGGRNAMRV